LFKKGKNNMSEYNESSISVLKGLDPVKERPGMYTRTESPLHIIQEVIDNAVDEALSGNATEINVTINEDKSVTIKDNGRGIPVGIHPTEGVSTVEVVFTRLHSGGKFNKKETDNYKFTGGLHGVGVSVTNALSEKLVVSVNRDGQRHQIIFSNGDIVSPLSVIGDASSTGTEVQVFPNMKYFDSDKISVSDLEKLLRSKAILLKNLKVSLNNNGDIQEWQYVDGMTSYFEENIDQEDVIGLPFYGESYIEERTSDFFTGEGFQWAIAWVEHGSGGESFVNMIPTPLGGTHEAGVKNTLTESVKKYAEMHSLMPKGINITADDVWSKVKFIISSKMLDPQFQGQTKDKLTSREAVKLASTTIKDVFDNWLVFNNEKAKDIVGFIIQQAISRSKQIKVIERKKGSGVAVLPGKLTDCESSDISKNEVFLVEGDSAGGSAKLGRDKVYQAIMPLRGKVLNTWEIEKGLIFENNEVHDISTIIGVDPHSILDETVDLSQLRYGKIIIMADADVDGSHIQTLLLTLFLRHFPKLIQNGNIYIAQPPLFKIDISSQKGKAERKLWALDSEERDFIVEKLLSEGIKEDKIKVSRFKGLGEMNPEQLKETTMNVDTRKILQAIMSDEFVETREMFDLLMKKSESAQRKAWMEEKGDSAEIDA
jgi:topoisomerase-4 subunit B